MTPSLPFPLERWASRSPRTRWPLVLLLIVALIGLAGGVAGCGGGDAADEDEARSAPTPAVNCHVTPELCK